MPPQQRPSAFGLLRRHDFRQLYLAVSISEIGDALSYIALMWFALDSRARSASLRCGWPTACPAWSSVSTAGSPPTAGAGAS